MATENNFYGRGWKFPPTFEPTTRQTEMLTNEKSIHSSLEILMGTSMGERLMQPLFGTDLHPHVFKSGDESTATMIRLIIEDAIIEYEPRISTNKVTVDTSRINEGILLVTIDYTIRRTNSRNNIVFPFYLQEGNLISENLM
jgi:phage baseplate assembly protein W